MRPFYGGPVLSPIQCVAEYEKHAGDTLEPATTFNADEKRRRSSVCWVYPLFSEALEVFAIRASIALGVRVASDAFGTPWQFTRYETGEFYEMHHDNDHRDMRDRVRKLSIVVQLSSPEAYDGGRVKFFDFPGWETPVAQGYALAFPSYLDHEVTPVLEGTRYSLVNWIEGPRWS